MSGVSKLGNNRYLATSKNVNRVLNQLNGILASDNITVQTVVPDASNNVNITFANGNFVNVSLPTASTVYNFNITDAQKGKFYILISQPSLGSATIGTFTCPGTLYKINKSTTNYLLSTSGLYVDMLQFVGDGVNYYQTSSILKNLG